MTGTKLRPADFGGDVPDIQNRAGMQLFKAVTVTWRQPEVWEKDGRAPVGSDNPEPGYLYALVRNHHRAKTKDKIVYIGITNKLETRFNNHPKAKEIVAVRGAICLSIGEVNFGNYRTAIGSGNRAALEEIEHLYIWTLWNDLENDRKMSTLPGMGTNAGRAWHITNTGHRFSGRMPQEIVFPWILVKPGRDRTAKN